MSTIARIIAALAILVAAAIGTTVTASADEPAVPQTCQYKVVIEDGMAHFRLVCDAVPYSPPTFLAVG